MSVFEDLPGSIARRVRNMYPRPAWADDLARQLDEAKILSARVLVNQQRSLGKLQSFAEVEFKVFSQFGDDGIIQYLVSHLNISTKTFVEFGVESYHEANTRLLLLKDNWRGMIIDGSEEYMNAVKQEDIHWRHDLTPVAAFITRDNINDLITKAGFAGELGILSVDIDGNDYWVWERLTCVNPQLVIAEYNSVFGADRALSVPYDAAFQRTVAHSSNLYWGCSLAALCHLANQKGYEFVGCNSNGNNAYFVRKDKMADLKPLTPQQGFIESKFRESRDADGQLTFISGSERAEVIRHLPLTDVKTGQRTTL